MRFTHQARVQLSMEELPTGKGREMKVNFIGVVTKQKKQNRNLRTRPPNGALGKLMPQYVLAPTSAGHSITVFYSFCKLF